MQEDIKTVVKSATEILVRFGKHSPTLTYKGAKGRGVLIFETFSSNTEATFRAMANAGVQVALTDNVGELHYLILVSEAWMSTNLTLHIPSKDPNRMEALIINTLDVETKKQDALLYQMIRGKDGELTELKQLSAPDNNQFDEVESPLLPAFVAGYTLIAR